MSTDAKRDRKFRQGKRSDLQIREEEPSRDESNNSLS